MKQLFILIFAITTLQVNAQIVHDESHTDLSFWKFKIKLEEAILKKDTTLLKSLLADRILESNDGCGNPGCSTSLFMESYFSERNGRAEITWFELQQIVRFGFYKTQVDYKIADNEHSQTIFQAPSYLKKVDTDNEVIILGNNVNIREQASLKSKIIKQVSYEVFKCDCNITTQTETTYQTVDRLDWLEIKLDNGKVGYVAAKFTSYNLIKELSVGKINGKWKIVSFYHHPGC